jgi:hypothetical protein
VIATLKSTFYAATLSLALAFGMTAGQTIVYPDTAQAGIISGVKKAAKAVGGGVKKAAVTVGSAGKKVGVAVGTAGKRVGVGVGSNVKKAAVVVGKYAAKTPPVKGVINAVKAVRVHAKRI